MDKLNMHTKNRADENFKKLAELFPNIVTEIKDQNGEIVRAIDKDILMQEINTRVVEGNEERYQFTWPDKKKSILLANAPIAKTLRPCPEESVDFDNTENLYIEGDNLDVLKLLQETYLGKVKMIYIDPPYNTGNDFVYEDNFAQSSDEYMSNSGQFDEEGNRLVKNLDSNGRFHTDWLNMIYPRLKLAKDLLSDDGVIFISIDDNEVAQLRKICDEIFGENNFVSNFIWQKTYSTKNNNKYVSEDHDYILCYAKYLSEIDQFNRLNRTEKSNKHYKFDDNDGRGLYRLDNITATGQRGYNIEYNKKIYQEPYPSGWRFKKETMYELIRDNRIYLPESENQRPQVKKYLKEQKGLISKTILPHELVGHTDSANRNLFSLMGDKLFDYPKTIELLKYLISLVSNKKSIILDFFSGSATTAHAVMELNAEDGGNRKYIMVQLPEETEEKSEAFKAGYKNICEIGKERIRRAGKKILEDNKDKEGIENLDTGFRVLKLSSSNMKDTFYKPADYENNLLDKLTDNIKEDRSSEDLLFQIMLDLGILLSSKIEESTISGKKVFNVAEGFLIACFDENVTEETIKAIAKQKPYYFVMRDSSMSKDSVATNFDQIFINHSPDTVIKIL